MPTGFILTALSFAIFYYNLCPTVYFWDSAELSATAWKLGIPHPPGVPFYVLWGRLFSLLPFGDLGYRLNLFSAVCGALSIFVLFLILSNAISILSQKARLGIRGWEYISAALMILFMGSYTSLSQATRAEVYYPNLLLISLAALFVTNPHPNSQYKSRGILLGFFLIGLGAGVHHLTVFLAIPGIIVLSGNRLWGSKRTIFYAVGAFLLGATILFFLPIRFFAGGSHFWGDPSSFDGFWKIFVAADFWKSSNTYTLDHLIELISFAASILYDQLGITGALGAIAGFAFLLKHAKRLGIGILAMLVLNIVSIFFFEDYFYTYLDLHGYLLLSVAIWGITAALGWVLMIGSILARVGFSTAGKVKQYVVIGSMALLLIGYITGDGFTYSLRDNHSADILAQKLSETLTQENVVICSSMNSKFLLEYRQAIDSRISSVNILDIGSFERKWYRDRFLSKLIGPVEEKAGMVEIMDKLANKYGSNLYVEFSPSLGFLSEKLCQAGILFRYVEEDSVGNTNVDQEAFPWMEGDVESTRFYLEWLLGLGTFYHLRGNETARDDCFKIITKIDVTASDMINKYGINVMNGKNESAFVR